MRREIGVVLLVSMQLLATAQESATQETNAPTVKFYQINTPNFQILYPKGFETQAQRMANTLDRIHDPEAKTMGVRPRKIPLILQNQSSISNAFVTLAPRRSEFYTMPSQNYNFLGTNDWLNLLASHEYRHVVQFQRSLTGFNKFFYYIFGQQAVAGFASAAAPEWFWEGDAVATETAFTHSGRGRIPNFNLILRTNFLEGRTFNYHKQYLRSYKNFINDHYVLGYHMVSWLRKKTGDPDIWEKIVKRSWSEPFIPFIFSTAVKRETGMYVVDLYKEMAASLTDQWRKELDGLTITPKEQVNPRPSTSFTNYQYPQVLADGTVVAQKSGLDDIETLVFLNNGKEEKKYVQGMVNATGMLSAASSRMVWNEYRFDPRWQVRTYTMVKGYDFKTKTATIISSHSRYAGASLSPDGNQVATVESGTDYQTKLVILDYSTGGIIKEVPNPNNDFISMARWSEDAKSIIALTTNKEGRTISKFDLASGSVNDYFPRTKENVGHPVLTGQYILYNSPYSNIDNLYALDTQSGKRFQITCSKYGAYNPVISPDGKTIYYNDQGRDGMDVVKIPFDPASWKPIEEVKIGEGLYQHLVDQEKRPGLLDSIPTKTYATRRYRRASGMINPHSWGPYFTNTFAQAQFGIYSTDILSTTSINGGYQYDINEKTGALQAGVSYQGMYPIFDFQILSGTREDKTSLGGSYSAKFNWKETGTTAGLRIPLVFTRSKYFSQLEFGNYFGLTHVSSLTNTVTKGDTTVSQTNDRFVPVNIYVNNVITPANFLLTDRVGEGNLVYNHFYWTYVHALKLSYRDFNPKWGQYLYFDYFNTPYGGNFTGSLLTAKGIFFFPGLFNHHSFFVRTGTQTATLNTDPTTYAFRNQLFKPRGYAYPVDKTFSMLSVNYELPLWYPDIAIGPLLNIQRVKANVFYDYGQGSHTNYYYDVNLQVKYASILQTIKYASTGVEVTFDINLLRLLQQVEVGFRVSRLGANPYYPNGGTVFEFLIGNIPF